MKINANAITFWAFLAILFHLCGGNWLLGLDIGLGISLIGALPPWPKSPK